MLYNISFFLTYFIRSTLYLLILYPHLSPPPSLCPLVTTSYPMDCSMPGFSVHNQLSELTQTHVCQVSDAIQPSHPLSALFLPPSIFPSIRVFSNESVRHQVVKVLEFLYICESIKYLLSIMHCRQ